MFSGPAHGVCVPAPSGGPARRGSPRWPAARAPVRPAARRRCSHGGAALIRSIATSNLSITSSVDLADARRVHPRQRPRVADAAPEPPLRPVRAGSAVDQESARDFLISYICHERGVGAVDRGGAGARAGYTTVVQVVDFPAQGGVVLEVFDRLSPHVGISQIRTVPSEAAVASLSARPLNHIPEMSPVCPIRDST